MQGAEVQWQDSLRVVRSALRNGWLWRSDTWHTRGYELYPPQRLLGMITSRPTEVYEAPLIAALRLDRPLAVHKDGEHNLSGVITTRVK